MTTDNWATDALCGEVGPDIFFPRDGESPDHWFTAKEARAVCSRCPVQRTCLEDAMSRESGTARELRAGMFGGLSPKERYRLDRSTFTSVREAEQVRRHDPATVERVRKLYDEGHTLVRIAGVTGLRLSQVKHISRSYGFANRRTTAADAALVERAAQVWKLRDVGFTRQQVAEALGVTTAQVDYAARTYPYRTVQELAS